MGSDTIALPLLDWFADDPSAQGEIVAVLTQPDRPAGRGQRLAPNPVAAWARRRSVPVLQPERIGSSELVVIDQLRCDLSLVMAYGQLLDQATIDLPRLGTLNLHTSLLPAFRGASPIQTAIAAGERETGVCLMRMVRAMDAGPIADVERVPISDVDTSTDVEARLAGACLPLVARTLPALAAGTLVFEPQDASRVSFCRKLSKLDGAIDFAQPAAALARRINGLSPWPGCSAPVRGVAVRFGLAVAEPANASAPDGATPGTVLSAGNAGLRIATGNGILRVLRLQRPGGRMLDAAEFLRGFPIANETLMESAPMPPLVAPRPFKR